MAVRDGERRRPERTTALSASLLREAEHLPLPPADGSDASEPTDVLGIARWCLDDMKAEDTVEIDLQGRTSLADTMLIATGRSQRHVGSIADRIIAKLKDSGHGRVRAEGMPSCDWVLIDAGDVIVHVFRPEVRAFYNLEKMWGADRPSDGDRPSDRIPA